MSILRILRQSVQQWRSPLLIAVGVTGGAIALSSMGAFQLLEWAAYGQFFRLRPSELPDSRIVIVEINESDITQLQRWPMSDQTLAQLLTNLKRYEPRVIGLDLYRDLPVEPGHSQLAQVFATTPNLFGVQKVLGIPVAPSPVLAERGQVAIADFMLDADGRVRRALLSAPDVAGAHQQSLGVALALNYLEAEGIALERLDETHYRLGQATFERFQGSDGGYVRADDQGYQVLLNYRGIGCDHQPTCIFQKVSLTQVLENRVCPELLRDRIVLIGPTAPSLNDLFYGPYSKDDFTAYTGVEIHAHLTSQIVSAALDGRALIQTWPEPVEWLWIFLWTGCSSLLGAHFLHKRLEVTAGLFVLEVVLFSSAFGAFLAGWWLPVMTPALSIAGAAVLSIGYGLWRNLKLAYQKLEDYALTLEQRVQERTEALRQEIEQRKQAEATLQALNQELQRLSELDGLTQVANRRRFEQYLAQEWQRALREQTSLSLILCDVDFFKRYNDTYGHPAGDRCLQKVAQALSQVARRPMDLVARYGGEEFAVILPNTSPEGALHVARSIQGAVQTLKIEHFQSTVSQWITVSIGVYSLIPRPSQLPASLVLGADQALYQAKAQGRNQAVLHQNQS